MPGSINEPTNITFTPLNVEGFPSTIRGTISFTEAATTAFTEAMTETFSDLSLESESVHLDSPSDILPAAHEYWVRSAAWQYLYRFRSGRSILDENHILEAFASVAHDQGFETLREAAAQAAAYLCNTSRGWSYATIRGCLERLFDSLGWSTREVTDDLWAEMANWEPQDYEPPFCADDCDCEDCYQPDEYEDEDEDPEPEPETIYVPVSAEDAAQQRFQCGCSDCQYRIRNEYPGDLRREVVVTPNIHDDQGDEDDYLGMPDMPETVPGRCRFGIEIEFNDGRRGVIVDRLQRGGIACLDIGYTHEVTRFWKMTTDATVTGGELVSPIMAGDDASINQVREALRIVKECGGTTGQNAGMHVHLDVTQFSSAQLKALAKNFQRTQSFLAAYVPAYRSTYGYSRVLRDSDWDRLSEWLTGIDLRDRSRSRGNRSGSAPVAREMAFNFNALLTYGTVECRLLGHTLNTNKVRAWIRTLQTIVDASRRRCAVPRRGDVLTWLIEMGLEQEYADYVRQVITSRGNEAELVLA